jgi:hypothetical protein
MDQSFPFRHGKAEYIRFSDPEGRRIGLLAKGM